MERLTTDRIREIAARYKDDYDMVAIRTQEHPFTLGPIDHVSSVWDDGEMTGETLPGISATNVRSPEVSCHASNHSYCTYYGQHQAIIAGNVYQYGEDNGEVIIKDAVVVEIIS